MNKLKQKLQTKLRGNKKGFTLAELLIVVAIIAILVAVAIPTFTSSLDKARLSTDKANVRAAYAEAVVKYLDSANTVTDGKKTTTTANAIADAATYGHVSSIKTGTITFSDTTTLKYDVAVVTGTYGS